MALAKRSTNQQRNTTPHQKPNPPKCFHGFFLFWLPAPHGVFVDAVSLQSKGNPADAFTFQKLPVDASDDFCLFRDYYQFTVFVFCIPQKPGMVDADFALLVLILDAHPHILADGLGFLLGKRCHDRDQDLTFGIQCIDIFLFKIDRNVLFLKLSDRSVFLFFAGITLTFIGIFYTVFEVSRNFFSFLAMHDK